MLHANQFVFISVLNATNMKKGYCEKSAVSFKKNWKKLMYCSNRSRYELQVINCFGDEYNYCVLLRL